MTTPQAPGDFAERCKLLWEELREERAHQHTRLDSYNVAAAALLGFEAVLVTLVPDVSVPVGWKIGTMVLLALSIIWLLWCLVGRPRNGPKEWRQLTLGEPVRVVPSEIATYLSMTADKIVRQLYVNEANMVHRNNQWLIAPKRRTLQTGVILFALAFVALLGGAVHQFFRDH
ncbi:hypothetical protein [Streptomyces sp. NBC_00140]|uniref:hypothetical protein n=1 Tax=Streptomyces sp. NBC_00140 TaxID=2975664 RepID=UPI00225706CD|nr:hypothetical protein [Streptomyces sp. NBC_00140]MCX5330003.1 hypothetical protein [Streptomyces sp. NBC_00140]